MDTYQIEVLDELVWSRSLLIFLLDKPYFVYVPTGVAQIPIIRAISTIFSSHCSIQ